MRRCTWASPFAIRRDMPPDGTAGISMPGGREQLTHDQSRMSPRLPHIDGGNPTPPGSEIPGNPSPGGRVMYVIGRPGPPVPDHAPRPLSIFIPHALHGGCHSAAPAEDRVAVPHPYPADAPPCPSKAGRWVPAARLDVCMRAQTWGPAGGRPGKDRLLVPPPRHSRKAQGSIQESPEVSHLAERGGSGESRPAARSGVGRIFFSLSLSRRGGLHAGRRRGGATRKKTRVLRGPCRRDAARCQAAAGKGEAPGNGRPLFHTALQARAWRGP